VRKGVPCNLLSKTKGRKRKEIASAPAHANILKSNPGKGKKNPLGPDGEEEKVVQLIPKSISSGGRRKET